MEELLYRALVIKFLTGEISDEEIETLREWLKKDPVNRRIFNEENEMWQETGLYINPDHSKIDDAWADVSKKLGIGKNRITHIVILNKHNLRILIAAASIACLIAIGGLTLWLTENRLHKQNNFAHTAISTFEGEKAQILLSDSTRIFMNSSSTIEYSNTYNVNERKVKLTGEAYFDVHKNRRKPFVVQLGKMSVTATGTRFNILSYGDDNRIETTLVEGIIHVTINGKETQDVKAGQQFVFFTKTNKAIIRDVPTETYTSWRENKLRFIDTPFEEVLRKLARRYNVVFEIRNHNLLELKYTATFIDESIDEVMQMLKSVSPITYTITNRTTINDNKYLKPKIVIGKKRTYR